MRQKERFLDYMQGFAVGLSGKVTQGSKVISDATWAEGFKSGRNARETAQRDAALDYIEVESLLSDRPNRPGYFSER